ncbi:sensor histidine kinase [Enterovibrio paralichthyis]|uniref:sensor histidine kinase n=1 Tax=Enterovibrio paralichthyis TaxID=2853805 RepID=UPI001C4921B6|nr:histidine kinase [Enterovibrio paralichthyis]MBV7298438.1 histidine kinase [Enterovibrio paralichthyis]
MTPNSQYPLKLSVAFTLTISIVIAYITQMIFGGEYYYHFAIGFGYSVSYFLLSYTTASYFPHWSNFKKTSTATIVGALIGTINMQFWIYIYHGMWKTEFVIPVLMATVCFSFFIAYLFITRERANTIEAELKDIMLKQAEQEKALIDSQLRNLQGQMEPHFLFNTLANIQVLIDSDAQKAKKLLEKITDLLRAGLKQQRKETISLNDEVKLLDSYLTIQQIRLSDRMAYSIHIDESLSGHTPIPPFIIQPAVENAIVHGIEPSIKGGHVEISFKKDGPHLLVEVQDNGIGFNEASKGNGVSMNNVRKRLNTLYGNNGKLELIPHHGGGFTTRIFFQCE